MKLLNLSSYKIIKWKRESEEKHMMNPAVLLKMKDAWDKFASNHPKFPMFIKAATQQAIQEGSIIEISITDKDGKKIDTNFLIKAEDIDCSRACEIW